MCEIVVDNLSRFFKIEKLSPKIIYIVNLIAYFNLLVNNKLITQFIIAFTFVNMSKIAIPLSVERNGFKLHTYLGSVSGE